MSPTASASIFELPPILNSICQNLSEIHINTCRLVCKDWASLFDPYRWDYIYFDTPSYGNGLSKEPFYTNLGPRSLVAVRKNSSRIRNLSIPLAELAQLLRTDQEALSRLQELNLRTVDGRSDFVDHVNEVFRFVTKPSSRLHKVSMPVITTGSLGFDYCLLPGLAVHLALTVLELRTENPPDPLVALAILKSCPPTLRKLVVNCLCHGFDSSMEKVQKIAAGIRESEEQYEWRRFDSLKILVMTCCMGGCESWVHLPILKNSPNLKFLMIGGHYEDGEVDFEGFRETLKLIPTTCPKIEHLHMRHGGQESAVSGADLVRLIQAYPKGLKSFHFVMPRSGQEDVFSVLVQTSATTLESVMWEYIYDPPTLSVETVSRLVQDCALLEDFRMRCRCYRHPCCPHVELDVLVCNQNKNGANWWYD